MSNVDLYEELPYKCRPVEWTAPERLALASLLHGGPRQSLDTYRVLELGCSNGANLLPQAFYRRHGRFVGIDRACTHLEAAESSRTELGLTNIEFINCDIDEAENRLVGEFDYIIAHGVFSWVPHHTRDALLRLCAKRLCPGGLLYVNYNAKPGWKIRGMVRDFLLAQTVAASSLRARAESARDVAAKIVSALPKDEHVYSTLIANEFQFVYDSDPCYVAHEYLAPENHSYWRSEFMTLVGSHGFNFVADADFNYSSGRISPDLLRRLDDERITGHTVQDTVDLLCYRQLHSAILTSPGFVKRPPDAHDISNLFIASCLSPCESTSEGHAMFEHPCGYRVEVTTHVMQTAFTTLERLWPLGLSVGELFTNASGVMDDLLLLHRNGVIELRCADGLHGDIDPEPLNRLENRIGGYSTSPYHTRVETVSAS